MGKNRRTRVPTEEKERSYKKDRYVRTEYPHAFRKHWPRKKARVQRKYRHQMRQAIEAAIPDKISDDELNDIEIKSVRRVPIRKWGAMRLEDIVQDRLERRAQTTLASFFKYPYDSNRDQARFGQFLESVVSSDSILNQHIMQALQQLLDAPQMIIISGYQRQSKWSGWLDAFLADQPLWAQRLQK